MTEIFLGGVDNSLGGIVHYTTMTLAPEIRNAVTGFHAFIKPLQYALIDLLADFSRRRLSFFAVSTAAPPNIFTSHGQIIKPAFFKELNIKELIFLVPYSYLQTKKLLKLLRKMQEATTARELYQVVGWGIKDGLLAYREDEGPGKPEEFPTNSETALKTNRVGALGAKEIWFSSQRPLDRTLGEYKLSLVGYDPICQGEVEVKLAVTRHSADTFSAYARISFGSPYVERVLADFFGVSWFLKYRAPKFTPDPAFYLYGHFGAQDYTTKTRFIEQAFDWSSSLNPRGPRPPMPHDPILPVGLKLTGFSPPQLELTSRFALQLAQDAEEAGTSKQLQTSLWFEAGAAEGENISCQFEGPAIT